MPQEVAALAVILSTIGSTCLDFSKFILIWPPCPTYEYPPVLASGSLLAVPCEQVWIRVVVAKLTVRQVLNSGMLLSRLMIIVQVRVVTIRGS